MSAKIQRINFMTIDYEQLQKDLNDKQRIENFEQNKIEVGALTPEELALLERINTWGKEMFDLMGEIMKLQLDGRGKNLDKESMRMSTMGVVSAGKETKRISFEYKLLAQSCLFESAVMRCHGNLTNLKDGMVEYNPKTNTLFIQVKPNGTTKQ